MTKSLTTRLMALGRAHDLIRPLPGDQGRATLLGDLLAVLLDPYEDHGAFSGRIRIAVPRMGVGERGASALAMVVHELATNSAKHGALSSESGALAITGTDEGEFIQLIWAETGGPEIAETPEMRGFGSRMMIKSIETQLAGSVDYDWQLTGLVATVSARADRIAI